MLMGFLLFAVLMCCLYAFEFPKVVDVVTDVPEKYRGLYSKDAEGKFALDDELHKKVDNSGLVTALDKERKRAKDLDKQTAAWKALGLADSPEEAQKLLEELAEETGEGGDGDGEGKGRIDKRAIQKLKADAEAAITRTKGEYEGKLTALQKTLQNQMIDAEAKLAIAALKGVPALLLPIVKEKCMLIEENGKFEVRVVDAEGDPRGDGKGGFLTIKDLVAEMRQSDDYGRAFEADGKSGSGKQPGSNGKGGEKQPNKTSIQMIESGLDKRR